jgi:hypothetical protein
MFWQVDGGTLNEMGDSADNTPHKESIVDLSGWHWNQNSQYHITFVAKDNNGKTIMTKDAIINVAH